MTNLQADDLNLGGEYYCGDIFPVLKQNLSVNQDNSLGFVFEPPPEGIPTYGGKATFYDQILLSNKGIEGIGKLEYLTSTSRSENFQFYPDSMIAETAQFNMAKDSIAAKFPIIASYDASLKWYPSADEFYSYRKEEDFPSCRPSRPLQEAPEPHRILPDGNGKGHGSSELPRAGD